METPRAYGFETEKAFVLAAAASKSKREKFRRYVRAFVRDAAVAFMRTKDLDTSLCDELTDAAMSVFDEAFYKYLSRGRFSADYDFTTYFNWWARQAFVRHLNL